MINIVDVFECKLKLVTEGFDAIPSETLQTILSDNELTKLNRGMDVNYVINFCSYTPKPNINTDFTTMKSILDTFVNTLTSLSIYDYTENEKSLFSNILLCRIFFNNSLEFQQPGLIDQFIQDVENLLELFKDYQQLDGIFLARENLKLGLLKLYDIIINRLGVNDAWTTYADRLNNLIQNIRQFQAQRNELRDTIEQIQVID